MSVNDITQLQFPDIIRRRPGMYIKNLETPEVILREAIDNSIDEIITHRAATKIHIYNRGSVYYVADNGRGFPIHWKDDVQKTAAELGTSSLHAGSKFENTEASIGQNGVGIKATNALSDKFAIISKITKHNWNKSIKEVQVAWKSANEDQKLSLYYRIEYSRGIKVKEDVAFLEDLSEEYGVTFPSGMSTITYFIPDQTMFDSVNDCRVDRDRFTYLGIIMKKRYKTDIEVLYNGHNIIQDYTPLKFEFEGEIPLFQGLTYDQVKEVYDKSNKPFNYKFWCYCSFEFTPDFMDATEEGSVNTLTVNRGVHINLIKTAIERGVAKKFNADPTGVTKGLKLLVVTMMNEAIYGSQTKEALTQLPGLVYLDDVCEYLYNKFLNGIFNKNKNHFGDHLRRVQDYNVMNNQLATKKYLKTVVKLADAKGFSSNISDKLIDCYTTKRSDAELFICEGDSAGGKIVQVCDSKVHAVLPLMGRPLNTISLSVEDMVKNTEMLDIVNSIGSGVNGHENIKRCRYGKVIIAADADPDGGVITSSILGMIAKHMTYLLEDGRIFVVESPLYRQGDRYIYPGDDVDKLLDKSKPYRRFKGLGELSNDDAYNVFINPDTRRLIQIVPNGYQEALNYIDKTDPSYRRNLMIKIGVLSTSVDFLDVTVVDRDDL